MVARSGGMYGPQAGSAAASGLAEVSGEGKSDISDGRTDSKPVAGRRGSSESSEYTRLQTLGTFGELALKLAGARMTAGPRVGGDAEGRTEEEGCSGGMPAEAAAEGAACSDIAAST
mmetsp:Transcript_6521/g.16614  ORF Transcript_6521/g.16614 Transcript_6521/m.16614 type:complete len:117 (-) Transcript_6521:273-623(-)